ncbi:hypothetical protein HYV10_02770 [Candidatus Dependentiae bacterium]|nr:hypothetical protein [Candidatus Dependentiae bacterium]
MKNIRLFVYTLLCGLSIVHVSLLKTADGDLANCPTSPVNQTTHDVSPVQRLNSDEPATVVVLAVSLVSSESSIPFYPSIADLTGYRRAFSSSSVFSSLDDLSSSQSSPRRIPLGQLDVNRAQPCDHGTTPVGSGKNK